MNEHTPMPVISIMGRKGGTAKTTLATNLSVEAERNGHTVALIDLDPQASAAKWTDDREAETPAVIEIPASRLEKWLEIASDNGATLAIIDTPAKLDGEELAIIAASSLVMIPCQPSKADVEAIKSTVSFTKSSQKPGFVVLTRVPPNTDLDFHARKVIRSEYEITCAPCQITSRVGYVHAYNSSLSVVELEPKSKNADEIRALYKYLVKQMEI